MVSAPQTHHIVRFEHLYGIARCQINWPKLMQAVEEQSGSPVNISRTSASTAAVGTE